jgi:lipoprotein-releasing system ATP-binding protein
VSLIVRDVRKEYPTRGSPLVVLSGVSFELAPGQALAIMGPSGSGKSTLLHILGTLERPTAGAISLDEQDPFALPEPALAAFRNQQIGFVFQDHYLLPQCSALENVLLPTLPLTLAAPQFGKSSKKQASLEPHARQLLERVGLAERLEHRPAELSGGERQRVAVARALINQPRLLLADEPTGNLDRKAAQSIGSLLLELSRQDQVMLIVVTHSAELAAGFAKRKELVDGKLEDIR